MHCMHSADAEGSKEEREDLGGTSGNGLEEYTGVRQRHSEPVDPTLHPCVKIHPWRVRHCIPLFECTLQIS